MKTKSSRKSNRVNITNCYITMLTILTMVTLMCSVKLSLVQDDRISELEKEIIEIKKEVISADSQSKMIQLHD